MVNGSGPLSIRSRVQFLTHAYRNAPFVCMRRMKKKNLNSPFYSLQNYSKIWFRQWSMYICCNSSFVLCFNSTLAVSIKLISLLSHHWSITLLSLKKYQFIFLTKKKSTNFKWNKHWPTSTFFWPYYELIPFFLPFFTCTHCR